MRVAVYQLGYSTYGGFELVRTTLDFYEAVAWLFVEAPEGSMTVYGIVEEEA